MEIIHITVSISVETEVTREGGVDHGEDAVMKESAVHVRCRVPIMDQLCRIFD